MAGKGRFDGDLGRFEVPDLTYHQDVRIGAQDASKSRSEGESGLRVCLDLVDALHPVLDRILHGYDVLLWGVEFVECSVEGGRLAATSRSRDQNHPVRPTEDLLVTLEGIRG